MKVSNEVKSSSNKLVSLQISMMFINTIVCNRKNNDVLNKPDKSKTIERYEKSLCYIAFCACVTNQMY